MARVFAMGDTEDNAPLYTVARGEEDGWRVVGPNGLAGVYETQSEAQARADLLNEQVAEETEDDS